MPPQTAKSGLAAKYGAKLDKAVKAHAGDETRIGMVNLPAGINNGVAQLTEAKFDTYKTGKYIGEYYFRATAMILEPEMHTDPWTGMDVPLKGLNTSIMMPCCDTKNDKQEVTPIEEHVDKILNEMRKLGQDTNGADASVLEQLAAQLTEAQPIFRFSTSNTPKPTKQKPNPRIWENWNGQKGLENYVPGEGAPVTNDQSGDDNAGGDDTSGGGDDNSGGDDTAAASGDENLDLDALLNLANEAEETDEVKAAREKLTELAVAAGHDAQAVNDAPNWEAVREFIDNPATADEPPPAKEPEKPKTPKKGGVVKYTPIDGKTKKPMIDGKTKKPKLIDCVIESINTKASTVDLKNLEDSKTKYAGVKFTDIIL